MVAVMAQKLGTSTETKFCYEEITAIVRDEATGLHSIQFFPTKPVNVKPGQVITCSIDRSGYEYYPIVRSAGLEKYMWNESLTAVKRIGPHVFLTSSAISPETKVGDYLVWIDADETK
jgi:hypothetical protein